MPTNKVAAKPVRISPPPGSEVSVLTFIEIEFNQAMAPPDDAQLHMVGGFDTEKPQLIQYAEYDAAKRVFRLPLLLPPKKKAQFTLAGFRSAEGMPVEPLKLNYQATGEEFSAGDRARLKEDAKAADLLALLEAMRQQRTKLTSLAERVQTLTLSKDNGVFTRLESKSATFQWQHPDRFYGDASQPMLSCQAFRIGSDGQNWWWHFAGSDGKATLTICPVNDMQTRNVSICDPFGLTQDAPDQVAAKLGLRLADAKEDGKPTIHLVEAWDVDAQGEGFVWAQLTQWRINRQTLRPDEVLSFHPLGITRTRFHYDIVNEKLPEAVFAVPKLEGVSPSPAEPLDADYTKRFINLRDGSDGRMSVRWGKKGTKATSSSGLN